MVVKEEGMLIELVEMVLGIWEGWGGGIMKLKSKCFAALRLRCRQSDLGL